MSDCRKVAETLHVTLHAPSRGKRGEGGKTIETVKSEGATLSIGGKRTIYLFTVCCTVA